MKNKDVLWEISTFETKTEIFLTYIYNKHF